MFYLIVLASLLLLSTIGATMWGLRWRANFAAFRDSYDEQVQRAMDAEAFAEQAKSELEWMKTTIATIAARQSFVVLSDEQLSFLCSSISQIVAAAMKDPTRLN